jgi:hypothetical protein
MHRRGYVEDIMDEELVGYWQYSPYSFEDPGFSYEQMAQLILWYEYSS